MAYADAAGDQQMFSRLWFDGEQIVGRGHRQGIARAHPLVHKTRAAFEGDSRRTAICQLVVSSGELISE